MTGDKALSIYQQLSLSFIMSMVSFIALISKDDHTDFFIQS